MLFSPIDWLVSFGLNRLAGRALSQFAEARELDSRLRSAALAWQESLPPEATLEVRALFSEERKHTDDQVSDRQARTELSATLRNQRIPPLEQWVEALLERWHEVRELPEEDRMRFFRLSEDEARTHLESLATSLRTACEQYPPLVGPELAELLRDVRDRMSSPEETAQGLDHRPVLKERLRLKLERLTQSGFDFSLRISTAHTYSDLIQRNFVKTGLRPSELLTQGGAVILHGPGGCGKSKALYTIGLGALDRGQQLFFLSFGDREVSIGDTCALDDLLAASLTGGAQHLRDVLERSEEVLLILDGLNEKEAPARLPIFRLLQDLLRDFPGLSVLVSDRLNPLDVPDSFLRATISPLEIDEISAILRKAGVAEELGSIERQLLSLPFFLDLQIRLAQTESTETPARGAPTRTTMLMRYFTDVAGVKEDIGQLAHYAFDAYAEYGSRTFRKDWWRDRLSSSDVERALYRAGAIEEKNDVQNDTIVSFRHQLLHDFLVARHLAVLDSERWNAQTFDAATFRSSSPESLFLAAEMVTDRADRFVEAIYDWNYPIAIECVSDLTLSAPSQQVSKELRIMIPALNCEKLFDRFDHAREGARERLAAMRWEEATAFRRVTTINDAVRIVDESEEGSASFEVWRELFTRSRDSQLCERDMELLNGPPFVGWTAANVFRRTQLDESDLQLIRAFYFSARAKPLGTLMVSRRWRAVHVLGRFPSDRSVDFLVETALQDPDHWVRYGAIRSLMELASHEDGRERRSILDALCRFLQEKPELAHEKILREVRRTSLVSEEVDPSWYQDVEPLLRVAEARATNEEDTWTNHFRELDRRKAGKKAAKKSGPS